MEHKMHFPKVLTRLWMGLFWIKPRAMNEFLRNQMPYVEKHMGGIRYDSRAQT